MQPPEKSFGFLLYDAARLLRRDFERRAKQLGLTRAQWSVLAHLARNEGTNQAAAADVLEIEPITLVRLLDRLEAAGWVERRPDPNDRRARPKRAVYAARRAEHNLVIARLRHVAPHHALQDDALFDQ